MGHRFLESSWNWHRLIASALCIMGFAGLSGWAQIYVGVDKSRGWIIVFLCEADVWLYQSGLHWLYQGVGKQYLTRMCANSTLSLLQGARLIFLDFDLKERRRKRLHLQMILLCPDLNSCELLPFIPGSATRSRSILFLWAPGQIGIQGWESEVGTCSHTRYPQFPLHEF